MGVNTSQFSTPEELLNSYDPLLVETPASPRTPRKTKLSQSIKTTGAIVGSPIKFLKAHGPLSPRVNKQAAGAFAAGTPTKVAVKVCDVTSPASPVVTRHAGSVIGSSPQPKSPIQHHQRISTQLKPSPPASPNLNRWRKEKECTSSPQQHQPTFTVTEKVLGEGAFAKVRLATNNRTGQKVAVKSFAIPVGKPMSKDQVEDFAMIKKERDILQKINQIPHNNVVKLHHSTEDETGLSLYLQLVEGGDTYAWLCERGRVAERTARPLFKQMVDAVAHCHSIGVCHRDVKLENFLLDRANMRPVLIDFGFATPIPADGYYRDFPGSPAYACPNILTGRRYKGVAADVYALGVVLYTMLYYRYPFWSESRPVMVRMICEDEPTFDPSVHVSAAAIDLMRWMLKKNCDERPTLRQIYDHPFVAGLRN